MGHVPTFAVNNRIVRVHGFTPAQLLFGFTTRGEPEDFTLRDEILAGMVEELMASWAEERGIEKWTQQSDTRAEERILTAISHIDQTDRVRRGPRACNNKDNGKSSKGV